LNIPDAGEVGVIIAPDVLNDRYGEDKVEAAGLEG